MTNHLPAIIVIAPLTTAMLIPLVAMLSASVARVVTMAALAASFASAVGALVHVLNTGSWHYYFGDWAPPWGIEYVIDPLAGGVSILVSFFSLLVLIYAIPHLSQKPSREHGYFYSVYLLLTAGLLGMVVTGDIFNLYVFLEISSISGYAIIAYGGNRATIAAFRYLIIGTVAASLYLLGVGYLYAVTGSLNMADLVTLLPSVIDSHAVVIAVALIVIGMGTKMALFPLHGWLPDAYSYAPAPVTAFISAVMAKVSAYVIYRMFSFVFQAAGPASIALDIVGWMAAAGIVAASLMAIAQRDIWRMLAYSSVGQMCYIALGLSLANTAGLYGALLHILNHAIAKGCLFMIAGGVMYQKGIRDIPQFAKLSRSMPWTMGVFVIAAMSMIGLPPMAGFFSKLYLVWGSIEAGNWYFVAALIISSLLTAIYFFRVIEYAYLKEPEEEDKSKAAGNTAVPGKWELSPVMLLPILLLGLGLLTVGLLSESIIANYIQYALPWGVP